MTTVQQQFGGDPRSRSQTVHWMPGDDPLTPRENEVMRCLARGRLYKEAADDLGISFSAVHKHQHNIFRKLHVGNRTKAAMKWMFTRSEV